MLRGKDLKEGMVIGTRRVRTVEDRGRWVYYTYDYLVTDNTEDSKATWYRQNPPPVGRIACNAKLPDPSPVAPKEEPGRPLVDIL